MPTDTRPGRFLFEDSRYLFRDVTNPIALPNHNYKAQDHSICKQRARGSNPLTSINLQKVKCPQKVTKVTRVVTKNLEFLTTDQVAAREGVSRKTVVQWCETGKVRAEKAKKGSRMIWRVFPNYAPLSSSTTKDWDALQKEWENAQSTGFLTGRHLGERGVEANKYGLNKFFQYLGDAPSIQLLTPENLRIALSKVPIDYKEKNCHFTQRDQMYKGFCSFYKFLILRGLRQRSDLQDIKGTKPKRIFPERKTFIHEDEFLRLIDFNERYNYGKSEYDAKLNHMLLLLMGVAGLRRAEVVNLKLSHVDLNHKILFVVDGKGHKNGDLPIFPLLESALKNWIENWRPETRLPNLLLTNKGEPITESTVNKRISRLAKTSGIKVTPHGLRRSCATLLEQMGMPITMIQLFLRHSDVKTTRGYLMTDRAMLLDWVAKNAR